MSSLKEQIYEQIDVERQALINLSCKIQENPEVAYEEVKASTWLSNFLEARGFTVERNVAGLSTAFIANRRGKTPGPTIAFLAEYDALPKIGHGCGHNLIGTTAVGAACGIAAVMDHIDGTVLVIGTPAEEFTEGKAGKIKLLEQGTFSGVDVCLMIHPWTFAAVARSDFGFIILDVTFFGKPAHAAADPWNGLNALDAVVHTYTGIGLLRQQMKPDARIHCIIIDGGDVVNVIPNRASLRLMFRSPDVNYLQELSGKIENCAHAASIATGTQIEINKVTHILPSRYNPTLFTVIQRNTEALGDNLENVDFWGASSDFGNLSHAVPALSMLIKTHEPGINWHSEAVARGAISEPAHNSMLQAAKVLAASAFDLLDTPGLIEKVQQDFHNWANY
jgi:amidohydrolase